LLPMVGRPVLLMQLLQTGAHRLPFWIMAFRSPRMLRGLEEPRLFADVAAIKEREPGSLSKRCIA
jgi:hypothetical protein